jgi:hypothetical protein
MRLEGPLARKFFACIDAIDLVPSKWVLRASRPEIPLLDSCNRSRIYQCDSLDFINVNTWFYHYHDSYECIQASWNSFSLTTALRLQIRCGPSFRSNDWWLKVGAYWFPLDSHFHTVTIHHLTFMIAIADHGVPTFFTLALVLDHPGPLPNQRQNCNQRLQIPARLKIINININEYEAK